MEEILDATQVEGKTFVYAGFWIRVGAILIDGIMLWVVQTIITFAFFGTMRIDAGNLSSQNILLFLIYYVIILLINWIYYAGMESSANQATLGKMAVGVKVTDLNGERIGFGKATGRYFGKIISGILIGIGFIMVAFSEKKQGLHDMMAGTLVVKK